MATLVLSAAGASLGGAFGGALGGIGAGVLGRAAGSIAGGLVDQQVFGRGSQAVETGRVDSFRLQSAQRGAPIPRVFGRMRVGGQLIWSSEFLENVDESRQGGKGGQRVRAYSYTVSFAVALAEGRISRIGRVWADGNQIRLSDYVHRIHKGGENQAPDPLIEAIEGAAPAFRGVAYVVFEDLPLGPFGNRIPQLNFEVFREPPSRASTTPDEEASPPLSDLVRAVALSPGSGEFALDTIPVQRNLGRGRTVFENVHTVAEAPDILPSLDQLEAEAPGCGAVSLVVSWFGNDLRCGRCEIRPAVETDEKETAPYSWTVNGVSRSEAPVVSLDGAGRPIYGGTPSDASVIRAIQEMKARGLRVMFYPFILMDIPAENTLVDPWTGAAPQPAFPWRGRITLERAPTLSGSTDGSAAAATEVAGFFGEAAPGDFSPLGETVGYDGPGEWSFRRFILHYAHLCQLAGGVDGFCIGSEMRSLTQIRSGTGAYPAVDALRALAADVRQILDAGTKIGYAADWSEYFGHQPQDGSGDVYFHLDPLWADEAIDFVGIDNYLPLSDWRYGGEHLDQLAGARSVYSLPYLKGNVAGGEGYDWYYPDAAAREAQLRAPIEDGAHGEPWIFRPKDFLNWWRSPHFNRPGGVRDATPTAWVPESKPIWFTELGCPAVDLGANQPNVFVDPKSSENALPYFSRGVRDDFMQQRYLQAMIGHWSDPANNPEAAGYAGRMVDLDNIFIWTWDARPWPDFPARLSVWSDGDNHRLGHWITGRLGAAPLADVVADLCRESGLREFDVSQLYGTVEGLARTENETARRTLQSLMLTFGFDAVESGGRLRFQHRDGPPCGVLTADHALISQNGGREITLTRQSEGELPRAVRFSYIDSEGDYQVGATEAQAQQAASTRIEAAQAPLALDGARAQTVADRWLLEARVAREGASIRSARSTLALEVGDRIRLQVCGGDRIYRIDGVEELGHREITLTRADPLTEIEAPAPRSSPEPRPVTLAGPVAHLTMDLPLLDEAADAENFRLAAFAEPWTSAAALFMSRAEEDFAQVATAPAPAVIGLTTTSLAAALPGLWTRDAALGVEVLGGGLASQSAGAVLNGANRAALRTPNGAWEIVQFREAELVGPRLYRLSGLLRGQSGTDAFIDEVLAPGADFVLLNGAVVPIDVAEPLRGQDVAYRVGPSHKHYTHESYTAFNARFDGVAYRPYRPAHLRAKSTGGEIALSWVRRTRIGGDAWSAHEPPLGETRELYRVRVIADGIVRRTEEVGSPIFLYDGAAQAADGVGGPITFAVAQISDRYGPGPEAKVTLDE